MPKISDKGRIMPASPIRRLAPLADQAKQRGIKVYHLNIGQPDIQTPPNALRAVRENTLKVVEYSPSFGIDSLRRKLSEYYKRRSIEIDPDQIMITTGGSEAISFAMMACMNNDDEIIVPEPFYANYYGFTITTGVKLKPIVSTIEQGFSLPPIEDFEKLITPGKTKAIIICNPNNPTGYLYSKKELEQLADLVKRYDLFLMSDEVYREYCYDGHPHFSVMNLKGVEEHTILIDSFSKRYSACGIRLGAFVTRNKEVMQTALKFAQARLSPPTFGQILAEAAIDAPQSYLDEVYREFIGRRDVLVEGLAHIDGVLCNKPLGAFYVMARLPVDDADLFSQWLLRDFQYEGQTVMLAPGSGFYSTPGVGTDEVRIAYVLNCEDIKKALRCLDEALKVYPGKKNK
ncbi:MAG: pyridoxal phosphate-dependent aminotransferase [Bacteroidales bacterium]|nr:pyridoxal phosphate-dependent aminotransferase [Bacteroidales bacterium]